MERYFKDKLLFYAENLASSSLPGAQRTRSDYGRADRL
jgi:hypothetical protein